MTATFLQGLRPLLLAVAVPSWRRQAEVHQPYPHDEAKCRGCNMPVPCAFRTNAEAALEVAEEIKRERGRGR